MKMMPLPSGSHVALNDDLSPNVSGIASLPSLFTIHTCRSNSFLSSVAICSVTVNVTRDPSGEGLTSVIVFARRKSRGVHPAAATGSASSIRIAIRFIAEDSRSYSSHVTTNPIVEVPPATDWSVEDAVGLYMIDRWGGGYFDVTANGDMTVAPLQENGVGIPIIDVVREGKESRRADSHSLSGSPAPSRRDAQQRVQQCHRRTSLSRFVSRRVSDQGDRKSTRLNSTH